MPRAEATRRTDARFDRPLPIFTGFEGVRSASEFAASIAALPVLAYSPRGDGAPVMLLPGLGGGDASTSPLRWFLRQLGHRPYGWGLGRNMGPSAGVLQGMKERLRSIAEEHEARVNLVGWSMGGLFARELAMEHPGLVRQVVTLGAPHRLFERTDVHELPVPVTAVYSRSDGVVPWRACLNVAGGQRENIEVFGSHFGYGHNPAVLYIIADRLALPDGQWWPYAGAPIDAEDELAS